MSAPVSSRPAGRAFVNGEDAPGDDAWLTDTANLRGGGGPRGGPGFGPPDGPMWGRPPSILRDMPDASADRGLAAPPVARYAASAGPYFVFDRSSGTALLKFDDSPEVWVLQPTPAPRGDVIYKNDVGDPVLRATRLGGLTLFSASAPGGEAAAMVGSADDLQSPAFLPPNAVFQHMLQASARASRAAQHLITFDANDVTPESAPVFADAATAAAEAVIVLSHRDEGRAFLRRLDKLQFQPGAKAGAVVAPADGGARVHMQVFIDASQGVAGRPSSERLARIALGK
ncbi:MAG TPA: DUF4908 domain-containing protein [Caulobacteraceae bacterium]|nr:DUF4908 domain-containing protein [Caulobacteraceae bacterium]